LPEAVALSNIAAGLVVGKVGTAVVSLHELREATAANVKPHRGVMAEDELVAFVRAAQQRQERVVMTNGCFDLLHPGHVSYLRSAKKLGDHLIVAVNTDASVQRLKGPKRPVNTLQHRMEVLAGLEAVDWVVPFDEDTPERLIKRLAPDVLVKGGDYQVHQIAGADDVLAKGGEVQVLNFEQGYSTTHIIQTLLDSK
jgi:D-beta-D-heptose 7-phosphate kinase/D-beta-D-heptose 1-phosphate adenosyltransferase